MSLNHTRYNSHDESMRKKQSEVKQPNLDKDEITNYDFKQDINLENEMFNEEKNNFFNSLLNKYREEIKLLKEYINRINSEIRKNFGIEIPLMEKKINKSNKNTIEIDTDDNQEREYFKDGNKTNYSKDSNDKENEKKKIYSEKTQIFSNKKQNTKKRFDIENFDKDPTLKFNVEFLKNYLDDALTNLINIDYINPILIIYDKHIKDLNEEILNLKKTCKKYEIKIIEYTQENKSLRENLLIKQNEVKDLAKIKFESTLNYGIVYDEDYIKNLDERNNCLSKENEIILLNYQKVYKEYIQFQTAYLEKHNENMKKVEIFDKVYEQLNQANFSLDDFILKNQICENKIGELVEINTKLEVDLEGYKLEFHKLRAEIQSLNESNLFYKNFIAKMNS